MKIVWTEPARQDLREIFEYIAEENPNAARALLAEIRKRAGSLKEYRKRNVSGAAYDDPRVAVAVGRFDEVVAIAEAQSKCKAIRHGVKSLRESWRTA